MGLIFLARLFYIQVLDQNYKVFAANNSLRKEVIFPARGLIYDRKGNILVRNVTIYDVMVIPAKVKDLDTNSLCQLLEVDKGDFEENFAKAKYYSRYKPSPIVRQITPAQYGRFQERLFEFRGFYVQARTMRSYPLGVAAHAIGYLGEVNDDVIKKDEYYHMGDYAGQSGLEKNYEKELRGQKGVRYVLVDVLNREQGRYLNGQEDIPSIAGKELMTGMDLKLQQYGEELMKGKRGSIIAIEPSTGEILTMVSMPSYDPNLLLGRERAHNYGKLLLDPSKPMFNRAISARYPPGSTFKTVESMIALQEHLINEHTTYVCSNGYHLTASITIHCHAHGTFDLKHAIQMSCNTYYCNVFRLIVDQPKYRTSAEGLEDWDNGLRKFGLGNKLGVDIPNESKGIVPTPQFYDKHYGKGGWHSSTIVSLGIGQAEVSLTPLQLANQAACIANRGYYITPHFVRAIATKEKTEVLHWPIHETGFSKENFEIVVDAMQNVVEHGTAVFSKIPGITFCGKTGTAQNPHGEDHSIFIAFAPRDNPKIAISVVVENAGEGAHMAAPIASLMIEKYLRDSVTRPYVLKRITDNAKKMEAKEKAHKEENGD